MYWTDIDTFCTPDTRPCIACGDILLIEEENPRRSLYHRHFGSNLGYSHHRPASNQLLRFTDNPTVF